MDTATTPWTWRPGAVTSSRRLLVQFELAQRMRETFFAQPASQVPAAPFHGGADASGHRRPAQRFILEIDGQRFDDRTAPVPKSHCRLARSRRRGWPSRRSRTSPVPGRLSRFDGPWAWFRLIDAGAPAARWRSPHGAQLSDRRVPGPSRGRGHEHPQSVRTAGLAAVQLRALIADTSGSRLLRQAAQPRRFPAPSRVGRVRGRLGRLAAGVPGGEPRGARRAVARRVSDEPGLALRLRPGSVRSCAGPRLDGAERRSRRALFPVDARRRTARAT